MKNIKISVITATFNLIKNGREAFFRQMVESVQRQTWRNVEHLIVDGGSSDGTVQMLEELELAYAVTIHKSQGSEYPAVVIPLLTGPRMLMNRNLLYTAVTRARSCVTLVGSPETFVQMIDNASEQTRYSGLYDRIREVEGCE